MTTGCTIESLVAHFKSVRVRGTDVLAVPLNESDMVAPPDERKGVGFKATAAEIKPEEPIRFVAVAVGPGVTTYGKVLPLDIKPGEVFISNVNNKRLRDDWKNEPRVLLGRRIFLFVAQDNESDAGAIPIIIRE